jgi:hypothetical protein
MYTDVSQPMKRAASRVHTLTIVGGMRMIKNEVNILSCMSVMEFPSFQNVKPLKMPIITAVNSCP